MTRKLYTEQLEKTKESNSSLNVKGMFIFIDHIFFYKWLIDYVLVDNCRRDNKP